MKPLPKHLEYTYLEKDSLLPVVISAFLKDNEKKRLVSVLKKHREAFSWKTSAFRALAYLFANIKSTSRTMPNPPWVSPARCVPKKGEMTVVTNEKNELVPTRTVTAHLVLNWEKCHFMVTEGFVLGHKVSSTGLEVGKAKIDVIAKLPPPTNVKAIRSFLGHARFYRLFIKDFSKISRPMTKLLEKDPVFDFNKECIKALETLKEKLTNADDIK
ncbi:hypothetical protein Tco_0586694 [Tanacetum coccineum]